MTASATHSELATRMDISLIRAMELVKAVNQPYGPCVRERIQGCLIWIGSGLVPVSVEDILRLFEVRGLVVMPGVVRKKDDLDMLVCSIKGIYGSCRRKVQRLHGFLGRTTDLKYRPEGIYTVAVSS